jgi:predicted GNAT superfamily acetyltransferase
MFDDGREAGTGGAATAADDAARAAQRAGVTIQALAAPDDLRRVTELFARVWDASDVPPVPHDLLVSLAHAGGCVHAAFRDGRLTGASAAVFGPPATASCYSLLTGVSPGSEGRGTGLALKLAQREWALLAGVQRMTWTFDPLLRRNAWFNLARLGAAVTGYLVDFYGELADGVNDEETDRLVVSWELPAALPARARPASGTPAPDAPEPPVPPLPSLLVSGASGEPVPGPGPERPPGSQPPPGPPRLRCWIPADIMAIRHTDPGLARRWRLAMRGALGGALDQGYRVAGLAEPGWYLLDRWQPAS